jgi:nitrogen fixation/metabolism regulation signal transduction histidine kinase
MDYLLVNLTGTVTVSAAFISNEDEEGLKRQTAEDLTLKRNSKIHAAVEIDLEAGDSNTVGSRRNSYKNYSTKKSQKGDISGKLVIVVSDSGVGLSRINLKRLFKEVFNSSYLCKNL